MFSVSRIFRLKTQPTPTPTPTFTPPPTYAPTPTPTLTPTSACDPGFTPCSGACCPEENWVCCPDGLFCAATLEDCP